MRITSVNEILKPPEAVFPWFAQPEKAMQWQKNVRRGEIIINKPEVVGTTFIEEVEEGGGSLEMTGIITRFMPDRLIEFHLESRIHKLDVNYSVEDLGGATRVTVDARIHWRFPMSVLSLFMGGRMRKGISAQLESEILDLKRLCETA